MLTRAACFHAAALASMLVVASPAHANWMGIFETQGLPLRTVEGAEKATLSCRTAEGRRSRLPPPSELSAMKDWLQDRDLKEAGPHWARLWQRALGPISGYLGRVVPDGAGGFKYLPVSEGATNWLFRSYQSDASAVEVVAGLAMWSRDNERDPRANSATLLTLARAVHTATIESRHSPFVKRNALVAPSADFAVTSDVFSEYFFANPVFFIPAPTPLEIRNSLDRTHSQIVKELQDLEASKGAFLHWKKLEDAVGSLGQADLTRILQEVKEAERERIERVLSSAFESNLRGVTYVGTGLVRPSTTNVGTTALVEVSKNPAECGITELEARAVTFVGELAASQARLRISNELRGRLFSLFDFAFASSLGGTADEETKVLLRTFYLDANAALARRAAYEFFWVFSYSIVKGADGRERVEGIVDPEASPETVRAIRSAEGLLNSLPALPPDQGTR